MAFGNAVWEAKLLKRIEARVQRERSARFESMFTVSKPEVKAKPMAKLNSTQFRERVDQMVSQGMSRRDAIQLLSERMGLSGQQPQTAARQYFRR